MLLFFCTIPLLSFAQNDSTKSYNQQVPGSEISFKMMAVPGGSFLMGSKEKSVSQDEGPAKTISVSGFWMAACEVSYEAYDAFFRDEKYSRNQPEADAVTRPSPPYIDLTLGMGKQGGFPANSMSQFGALMFCRWVYKQTGLFYRLPTEAEWEYACRAGSSSPYFFGEDSTGLGTYAWYAANSNNVYHKTGLKEPNKFGLHDMLGNVAEWTLDQYDENYFTRSDLSLANPLIMPNSRHPRTLKGGSYRDEAISLRSAARIKSDPAWNRRDPQIPRSRWWNADAPFVGFRVVRPYETPSEEAIKQFFKLYLDTY
ncbi:MAG: SUMF1/EgtB/PvdO family nonheme iron enzyme [Ginsengibacter sp.]